MNYLDRLPNDLIYIIYEKKHRLEYPSVMRELKDKVKYCRNYYPWTNNSKVRVGDSVKCYRTHRNWEANILYVVIWKGKKFIDLYDYNSGKKIRKNYKTGDDIIRPSTIDYILREIVGKKWV